MMIIFGCGRNADNPLNITAHQFIDKFFLNPDYASLEMIADSAAADIIRHHIRHPAFAPQDSATAHPFIPSAYIMTDSSVHDSAAEYSFRLYYPDPASFEAPAHEGFLRLSRYRRTDWKVVDFGYRTENQFAN